MNAHTDQNKLTPMAAGTAPEIIHVPADADSVACDGGHGSLGHPMVYYRFDGRERVTCGYCDREFIKEK